MTMSKSDASIHCIFVHIEKYTSSSSSKVQLSQIAATSVTKKEFLKGSLGRDVTEGSNIFIPVKPSDSFAKILDTHKWSGDVLQALRMTKEDNGDFFFRKQIEVTSKKILCRSEKTALSKFCDFIKDQQPVFMMVSDKENLRILISKCREIHPEKFNKLEIKGYTYWKRSLQDFAQPYCELEEFYLKTTNNNVVPHPTAKDIVGMLKFCYLSLVNTRKQILKKAESISLRKLTKGMDQLGKTSNKRPQTSVKGNVVIELASGTSKISSSFSGKKMEQVLLESESEDDVIFLDSPQPRSKQEKDDRPTEKSKVEEYVESDDNDVKTEPLHATSCVRNEKQNIKASLSKSCSGENPKVKVKVQNMLPDHTYAFIKDVKQKQNDTFADESSEDEIEIDVECDDIVPTSQHNNGHCKTSWKRRFPESSSEEEVEVVPVRRSSCFYTKDNDVFENNPGLKFVNSFSKFNMRRKKRKVDGKILIRCNLCEEKWFPEEDLDQHYEGGKHLAGMWCRQRFPGTAAIVYVGNKIWECDICHQEHLELESGPLSFMKTHLEAFHSIKDVTKFLQIRGIKLKLTETELNKRKQEQAMRSYTIPRHGETSENSNGISKKKRAGPRPSWMKALPKSVWW